MQKAISDFRNSRRRKKCHSRLGPAHVGIPGIEKIDALAKTSTTREQMDRWIPASVKDVKRPATSSNNGIPDGKKTQEASIASE